MCFFCGFFDFVVCDSAIQSEVRQFPRMNVVRKKAARVKLDSGSNPIQSILRIDSARQLSIELVFLHHLFEKKMKNQSFQTSWSLPTPFLGLCLPFPNLVVFAYPSLPFPDPNPVVFAYPFLVVIFATGISVLSKRSLRLLCEKKSNCVPLFVLWTVLIGTIGDNSVQTVMRWYC